MEEKQARAGVRRCGGTERADGDNGAAEVGPRLKDAGRMCVEGARARLQCVQECVHAFLFNVYVHC